MKIEYTKNYAKLVICETDDWLLHNVLTEKAEEAEKRSEMAGSNQKALKEFHISLNSPKLIEMLNALPDTVAMSQGTIALDASWDDAYAMTGYAWARNVRSVEQVVDMHGHSKTRASSFIRFNSSDALYRILNRAFSPILKGEYKTIQEGDFNITLHISLANKTGSPYNSVKDPMGVWLAS